jgi:hypothetical protein
MEFTLDSKLGDLLDNEQARKVLDQYAPGVSTMPQIAMFKGATLRMIVSNPMAAQLGLTEEKVKAMLVEVNKVV